MKKLITILDWDTDLFGKNVCSIDETIVNKETLHRVTTHLVQHNIDLAYYSGNTPLANNLLFSEDYLIRLVDRKTTYLKTMDKNSKPDRSVIPYDQDYPEPKLIELAVESGANSRFRVDEKIGYQNFEELYKTWIINSVNKRIAMEVLVYRVDKTIAGFVTLGEKKARADIGLIAVDSAYRGKGIGSSLMRSAESWFAANTNFDYIQVVTQGANAAACRLYEKGGFAVDKVEYVYHFWRTHNA